MVDFRDYTFIDFGASGGGSLKWAASNFGGRGVGVDIDERKIAKLKQNGFDGVVADATELQCRDNSVRYVTMMNFLEHLPDRDLGEKMIESATRVASDFVFILGPDFDAASPLRKLGLKKYYADWSGHTWRHTTKELSEITRKLKNVETHIVQFDRIHDSNHRGIQPLAAKRNRGPYDKSIDPDKPFVMFKNRIYRSLIVVINKSGSIPTDSIVVRGLRLNFAAGECPLLVSDRKTGMFGWTRARGK